MVVRRSEWRTPLSQCWVAVGMNAAEYVLAGGLAIAGRDKPAIVSGDGSVTYGELAGACEPVRGSAAGVRPKTR